jgi:hypothetical protein
MLAASFLLALPLLRFRALGGSENRRWRYWGSWLRTRFNVPVRAIYSKTDSVVAWKACIDEHTAEIEYHEAEGEP